MKFKLSGLVKDTIVYGVGDFIVTGVHGFLLLPIYVKYLSQDQYGQYGLFTMNVALFTYLVQLGLISGFARVFFMYEGQQRRSYLNTILTFHFLYVAGLTGLLFLLKGLLHDALSPALPPEFFYLSYLTSFLTFLPALYSIQYRLQQQTTRFVAVQLATVAVIIAAVMWALPVTNGGLGDLLFGLAIANGLVWLFFFLRSVPGYKVSLDREALSKTFTIAIPVFFSYVMLFVVNKFGLIVLQRHTDLREIGLFSFFQQVSGVLLIISIAAGKALQPVIFSSDESQLKVTFENRDKQYKNVLFFMSALLIVFAKEFILIFFNAGFAMDLEVFYMLVLSGYLYTSILLQNTVLQYFMKSRWLFNCVLLSGLVSIAANYLLVSTMRLTLHGAAIASVLSLLTMAGVNYWYTSKLVEMKDKFNDLVPVLKLIAVAIVVLFVGSRMSSLWLSLLVKAGLACVLLADLYISGALNLFTREFRK